MKHKNKRQLAILEIIKNNDIDKQDDFVYHLALKGIEATQATVSRDIKQLNLVKVLSKKTNKYRYEQQIPDSVDQSRSNSASVSLFKDNVLNVATAQNLVIIKCNTGMAQGLCVAIDALGRNEIIGTIAGDDTVFIATADSEQAGTLKTFLEDSAMGV